MKAGWEEVTLSDIVTLNYGKALAKSERSPSGAVPVYGANGVMDRSDRYLTEGPSLVIGRKGTAGAVTAVDGRFWPADVTYYTTHDASRLDFQFLHFALSMLDLPSLARGVKPGINRNDVYALSIPLPPLEEQQRIVAILDEAFEGLDRAKANAEANLASARELFEGWSAAAFTGNEPEGASTLGEVCTIQSGAGFPKKHQGDAQGEFPFYKVSDMNLPGNESALLRAVNYIGDDTRIELGAKIFPKGAIVFPKVGGAILTNKKRVVSAEGCVDNNVMGLIPNTEKIEPEYLHELVRAMDIYDMSNKANPPSITQGTVRDWPIHVPDRQRQLAIVAEANRLRSSVADLTDDYETQAKHIAALRQSLLAKAFAGELT